MGARPTLVGVVLVSYFMPQTGPDRCVYYYVYGAFLATAQAKTATTGTLICAKRFPTSKVCEADDQLAITYGITLTTS